MSGAKRVAEAAKAAYRYCMSAGRDLPTGLFEPLNVSAYITWLAVLLALLDNSPGRLAGWETHWSEGLLVAFLLAFIGTRAPGWLRGDWRPYALLILQAVLALGLCMIWRGHAAVPVLTIIVVAECALLLRAPALVASVVTLNAGLWWVLDFVWREDRPEADFLIYVGFQIFAAVTVWYARRAKEAAAALRETNAHLLATRSLLEESARDHERLRLARELHDVAGHKLTALKLNLSMLGRNGGAAQLPALQVASRLATELLDDIRAVVAQLRMHDGMDLHQALSEIVAPFPQPPQIHLEVSQDARPENVAQAEALLRAAQEALTNIARHSNAGNAWLRLWREGDAIRLLVRDDGHGASELRESNGLLGMRERLGALGGSLHVSRAAAGGVTLDVILPLN
jgi:signal transduction histidine kinase